MPAVLQRVAAIAALVILSLPLTALALAVRLTSVGPALYRAERISRARPFTLYKFRTMTMGAAERGPAITTTDDPRITTLGTVLRRTKLDELPQLWNVARGEMLLVGPRPEDPRYINWDDPVHRKVFAAIPGITGPAAIAFRHEERILSAESAKVALERGHDVATPDDVDVAYRERILPTKVEIDLAYLQDRSIRRDLIILGQTLQAVFANRP
jgi:lipopolysaccharide/colanic/teichoic acid biosynthesis glycosyltransferase